MARGLLSASRCSGAQQEHRARGRATTPSCVAEPASSCVHAGSRRMARSGSALERGVLVHGDALDERADDAGLADRAGAAVEQVAVEDGEVGQLADLERAGVRRGG